MNSCSWFTWLCQDHFPSLTPALWLDFSDILDKHSSTQNPKVVTLPTPTPINLSSPLQWPSHPFSFWCPCPCPYTKLVSLLTSLVARLRFPRVHVHSPPIRLTCVEIHGLIRGPSVFRISKGVLYLPVRPLIYHRILSCVTHWNWVKVHEWMWVLSFRRSLYFFAPFLYTSIGL